MAMPCDAPPSAPLSPKANSAPSTSVWGRSGDAEGARAGTGTDKVMSVGGTVGGTVAEDWVSSGAWDGVGAAMGGGASSQGASTHCPESCTLSAGGCTDSHTQTHANSIKDMHISSYS